MKLFLLFIAMLVLDRFSSMIMGAYRTMRLGEPNAKAQLSPGAWIRSFTVEVESVPFHREVCNGAVRTIVQVSTHGRVVVVQPRALSEPDTGVASGDDLFDQAYRVGGDLLASLALVTPQVRALLLGELTGVQIGAGYLWMPIDWSGPEHSATQSALKLVKQIERVLQDPERLLVERLELEPSASIRQRLIRVVEADFPKTELLFKVLDTALEDSDLLIRSYAAAARDTPAARQVALECLRSPSVPTTAKLIHVPWSLARMDEPQRREALKALLDCGALGGLKLPNKQGGGIFRFFSFLDGLRGEYDKGALWQHLASALFELQQQRQVSAQGQLALVDGAEGGRLSESLKVGAISQVPSSNDDLI